MASINMMTLKTMAMAGATNLTQSNMNIAGLTEDVIASLKVGAFNKVTDASKNLVDMYDYLVKETSTSLYICFYQQDLVQSKVNAFAVTQNTSTRLWTVSSKII